MMGDAARSTSSGQAIPREEGGSWGIGQARDATSLWMAGAGGGGMGKEGVEAEGMGCGMEGDGGLEMGRGMG
ncbi:MAG TPA: hypothetical protein VLL52_05055 [Anaerolineae bacterium]|nr:hypothetical protein [Anaerolineae bacterium]